MLQNISLLQSKELIGQLKTLVQKEKAITLRVIEYLTEIQMRKAYLPKYTSMFTFLTGELGYCPATAQLRIHAMKALAVVPEVKEKILNNEVSLNSLAKVQSFINQLNKQMQAQWQIHSREQVGVAVQVQEQALINEQAKESAEVEVKAKVKAEMELTVAEQRELLNIAVVTPVQKLDEALQTKRQELDTKRAQQGDGPLPPPLVLKKKYNLVADAELVDCINELKSLLSHQVPFGDLVDLLKQALPLAIRELKIKRGLCKRSDFTKEKTSVVKSNAVMKSNEVKQTSEVTTSSVKLPKRSRHIPNEIKRKVWHRDQGRCQHKDHVSGKKCGSTYQIQADHLQPWSYGGAHSLENIQLRCAIHNRYRWESRQR